MIFPGVSFLIFQNFDFPGCQEAERGKNGPRWKKSLSVAPYISGTIYHIISPMVHMYVKKDNISRHFFFIIFFFQNFDFPDHEGGGGGKRAKNSP